MVIDRLYDGCISGLIDRYFMWVFYKVIIRVCIMGNVVLNFICLSLDFMFEFRFYV